MRNAPLPIDDVLPQLLDRLQHATRVVLQAPPGAGKTTRVPLALLHESWVAGRRIIMLEPRRLAARAAAAYMARSLGEAVGGTVGYRVRLDTKVSARTRVEIVTEGVLTRMLQDDPSLDGIACVIFDEFHERSIHADTGLALTLQTQSVLREDLRILVMSATLDATALLSVLDDAPVLRSEGRMFPVETVYASHRIEGHIEPAVVSAIVRAAHRHDGDVLVFLPGAAEIRRTAEQLRSTDLAPDTRVCQLYGDLPQDEQDRAIAPSPHGTRKIVLATSIAETSITIEGVRVVIDSGLMRVPRFSPRTGMTRLVTVPVSRAAADQRRGRAGRLGPGTCYRLWTEGEHAALLAHRPPEILEADLAPLVLELAAWGVIEPDELRWIDAPPAAAYAQARELLRELDALDDTGRITQHGRRIATLSMHPRLAHMLLRAHAAKQGALGADIAALLGERDIMRHGDTDPDVRLRVALLRGTVRGGADEGALRRARTEAEHWRRRLHITGDDDADVDDSGLLLAFAYPDRIAQQRGGRGRFLLRNGRGAMMEQHHNLAAEPFLVVADVGGHGRDSRIFLAAPVAREAIEQHFAAQIETRVDVQWDDSVRAVRAREVRMLGAIALQERVARNVDTDLLATALCDALRTRGLALLAFDDDAMRLRQRIALLHQIEPDAWPDVSDESLIARADEWLLPFITDATAAHALSRVDVTQALLAYVGWEKQALLDELAPTHIEVPSGSRVRIDYTDPAAPVLAVRLQEMFGLADTPRIARGRLPLTLHLLSPAQRPVQVTRDLASFWRTTYFEVRKDLRGRYPRHYWPEDPLQAEPTRRARPRG